MRVSDYALVPAAPGASFLGWDGAATKRFNLYDANGNVIFNKLGIGASPTHLIDILTPGSTAAAPLRFAVGSVLATPTNGCFEYDGQCFYGTPSAGNRGAIPTQSYKIALSDQAAANVATPQPWFVGGGTTGITLTGATTYAFEGHLVLTRAAGTTSHTISLLYGGTATFTAFQYTASITDLPATVSSLSAGVLLEVSTVSPTVVTTASAGVNQYNSIYVRGIGRVAGGGTFIPQFQYSAAPGGVPTVQANSWFRLNPLGPASLTNIGNWT